MRILLRDLSPNTAYQLQLASKDSTGRTSEFSRVFSITTTGDAVAPKTPTNVTNTVSGTAFKFTWDAVTQSADDSPAHDLKGYFVSVSSPNDADVRIYETTDTKMDFSFENNVAVFGTPQAAVRVAVAAVDNTGNISAYSTAVLATNPAPVAVTGLAGAVQNDGINLKWNANTTDPDLKNYEVQVSTNGASGTYTKVWSGNATAYVHPSTLYGVDHFFRVFSVDVFNTLSPAAQTTALRPASPFAVDTTAPATPTGLAATLTNATDGKTAKAAVTWNAVTDTDGDLSEYIVDYKPSSEGAWNTAKVDYEKTALTILGLLPYVNYDFRIRASDFSANLSNWSSTLTKSATANTAPATVAGVAVVAGVDGLTVSWDQNTEPDVQNGAGTYLVNVSKSSTFASGVLSYRTGGTAITISGLDSGTIYYARVKAVDSLGLESAAWSTTANATTAGFPVGNPFKHTVSATEPPVKNTGDVWMDLTSGFEKQWNGSTWILTGNATIKYVSSKGTDLVANGTGLLGNNYNFSTFVFDPADSPEGASGSFLVDTTAINQVKWLDENIPIDPLKPYIYAYSAKQKMSGGAGRIYGAIAPLDAAGNIIATNHYTYLASTSTTLTAPLNPGDMSMTVASTANWRAPSASQFVIFWNWVDSFGKTWAPGTYSRNGKGYSSIVGNVINFSTAYTGPALPAGSPVANSNTGGSYIYIGAVNSLVPESWQRWSGQLGPGVHDGSAGIVATSKVPPGTAFVRLGFLANYSTTAGTSKIAFANVSLSDAAAAQATAETAIASANGKNKIIHSTNPASGTVGFIDGDTWVQYDGSNKIIAQSRFNFATQAWVAQTISSQFIAELDAGKLTANSAFLTTLNMGTGGIIQSAGYTPGGTSGFRLSETGLIIKGSNNTVDGGTIPVNTIDVNSIKTSTLTATTINLGATGVINIDSTGAIKSNNYALNSTGYKLSNTGLEINDGSVDAKALKTNTAIIGDLTIGRSADSLGTLKSFDYSAGTAGWKIGKGLFEINNGLIKAAALQLQTSPNLMPPQFADFEYQNDFYISPFWNANGQGGMAVAGGAADSLAVTAANRFKGTRTLSLDSIGGTAGLTAWFGTSSTDYNISLEPGKTYIWSAYIKNRQASSQTWTFSVKGDNGAIIGTQAFALDASEAAVIRRSFVFTVPAGVNAGIVSAAGPVGAASSIYVDGMQLEEKTGADNTPSVWSPPGATTMNGAGITTGMIRSNNTVTVNGAQQPAWSINLNGNAQFGDALVRGRLFVGQSTDVDAGDSYISSGNFLEGAQGWKLDSAGDFEANSGTFRGTLLGASIYGSYIGTTDDVTKARVTMDGINGFAVWKGQRENMIINPKMLASVSTTTQPGWTMVSGTMSIINNPNVANNGPTKLLKTIPTTPTSNVARLRYSATGFVLKPSTRYVFQMNVYFHTATANTAAPDNPYGLAIRRDHVKIIEAGGAKSITLPGNNGMVDTGSTDNAFYNMYRGSAPAFTDVYSQYGDEKIVFSFTTPSDWNNGNSIVELPANAYVRGVGGAWSVASGGRLGYSLAIMEEAPDGQGSYYFDGSSNGAFWQGAADFSRSTRDSEQATAIPTSDSGFSLRDVSTINFTGTSQSRRPSIYNDNAYGLFVRNADSITLSSAEGNTKLESLNASVTAFGSSRIGNAEVDIITSTTRTTNTTRFTPEGATIWASSSGQTRSFFNMDNGLRSDGTTVLPSAEWTVANETRPVSLTMDPTNGVKTTPQVVDLVMSSGFAAYSASFNRPRAMRTTDGAWVLTGLVIRSGGAFVPPTTGVSVATIPGFVMGQTELAYAMNSNASANLAWQISSAGVVSIRTISGTGPTIATGGFLSLSGVTLHEKAGYV